MVNNVQLIGRLGRDPEVRVSREGALFARFSLATDTVWTDADGTRKHRTEWHSVMAWGRLAEICGEYLRRGRLVYVAGRLQTRTWEDDTGCRHGRTEVVIHDLQILDPRPGGDEPAPHSAAAAPADLPA